MKPRPFSAPRRLGISIAIFALALAAPAYALAAETIPGATVESLLLLAREKNPDLAVARLEAEAARERVLPAGALPDPLLRLELENITNGGTTGVNLSPSRVGDTKYTLIQPLPFPGKRELRRDMARAEAEAARLRSEGNWLEVASRLKAAHADWWLNSRNAALNRELLDLMASIEKVAQVRYAGGLAPQQDAIRAQVERTNLLTDRLMLEHERHTLSAFINSLLARPPAAPLAAGQVLRGLPPPLRLTPEALGQRLLAASPALAAEEARLGGARAGRDLTFRERYPDFALGVAPMQVRNGIASWNLMLEVNLPLQQESRRSKEREAEHLLAASEARRASLTLRLRSELENAQAALDVARETETLVAGSLLPQAELGFQAALAGYEAGKLDFATLLDAQRQVKQARQALYKAQAGQRSRLADIERLVGEEL